MMKHIIFDITHNETMNTNVLIIYLNFLWHQLLLSEEYFSVVKINEKKIGRKSKIYLIKKNMSNKILKQLRKFFKKTIWVPYGPRSSSPKSDGSAKVVNGPLVVHCVCK